MKFPCPQCRHELILEDLLMDADLGAIIKMQPVFGAHAHLVWAYCELFGITPLKTRRKKLRLLLEEMKTLFQTGEFTYQKKRYRISEAGVADALNVMVHKHWTAHLENQNYLKKVMIGITEASAKDARKEEERDLRKREERLRYPYQEEQLEPPARVLHYGAPEPDAREEITEEQRQNNLSRVRDILKRM